ncbi:MAG TPA: CopG family antitoxin [Thermoanaerobaculia bacterium]|nr:CopG family antitoxin [Thermoanaerobaculia bacterium]
MSDRKSSISKARSYEEMGEYWDTHDASEAWDQGAPVEFEIDIKSDKRYYPIEKTLSQKLTQIARAQGVSAETLINLWIQEKIALAK